MPVSVVFKDLNLGYAGKISRNPMNKIGARFVKSILNGSGVQTLSNVPFGSALVLNGDNTVSLFGQTGSGVSSATAATFAGIAVAETQQAFSYATGAAGGSPAGYYQPTQAADVLLEGSCTVFLLENASPAAVAGGPVYIVTGGTVTTSPIGSFATSASTPSGATGVQLTNCSWTTGKVDANNIAELTIRYAVNP